MIGRYYHIPVKIDLEDAVKDAVKYYIKTANEVPDVVFVHPDRHTVDLVTVGKAHILIEPDPQIYTPSILWVCKRKESELKIV